jgi:hypothetical protein
MLKCAEKLFSASEILPQPKLAGTVHIHNCYSRARKIEQTLDVFGIALAHENADEQRINLSSTAADKKPWMLLVELCQHVLRAAVDISALPRSSVHHCFSGPAVTSTCTCVFEENSAAHSSIGARGPPGPYIWIVCDDAVPMKTSESAMAPILNMFALCLDKIPSIVWELICTNARSFLGALDLQDEVRCIPPVQT